MTLDTTRRVGAAVLPWVATVACTLFGLLATDLRSELMDHRRDIATLKEWRAETRSSNYTVADHNRYAEAQAAELSKIWRGISDLQGQWIREVSEVKTSIARIEATLEVKTK